MADTMATEQFEQTLANNMVEKALEYCGQTKFGGDAQEATHCSSCRCDACGIVSYYLVQE
jgi:hypothetical protein